MRAVFGWYPVISWLVVSLSVATAADPPAAKSEADQQLRAQAKQFVEAFDRHDATAVAAHWTNDGVYTDDSGVRMEGRAAIEAEYKDFFAANPNAKLLLEVDSIRQVGADTAIEEGRSAVVPQPEGESRLMSRYTAVHVRQDGKWLMTDVRESTETVPPHNGDLADLESLIGNWQGSGPGGQLTVHYRWMAEKKFLTRTFTLREGNQEKAAGLEVIGVEPSTGQITSWSFTSDGGHTIGYWFPNDKGWTVQLVGSLGDGTPMEATNEYSKKDDQTLSWSSKNRSVDDAMLPDVGPFELKRQPAAPATR
ncbi:MAG: SgcJ/EcaC family oxidoreductase [Pirellulales bacterium]